MTYNEVYKPNSDITDDQGSISRISESVSSDQGFKQTQKISSPEEEFTPSISEDIGSNTISLIVIIITYFIALQQQSQLFKLEKDVTDKQRIEEVTPSISEHIGSNTILLNVIMITYFIALEQSKLFNVSKLEKNVYSDGTDDDSENDSDLFTPTWRDFNYVTYDVLIIGSFGEMSDSQTIQVAHKLASNDQEGSDQWMTKEIDLISGLYKTSPRCHHVFVCIDFPEAEHSKDYYLEKIRNFLTRCKQDKGKREIFHC